MDSEQQPWWLRHWRPLAIAGGAVAAVALTVVAYRTLSRWALESRLGFHLRTSLFINRFFLPLHCCNTIVLNFIHQNNKEEARAYMDSEEWQYALHHWRQLQREVKLSNTALPDHTIVAVNASILSASSHAFGYKKAWKAGRK